MGGSCRVAEFELGLIGIVIIPCCSSGQCVRVFVNIIIIIIICYLSVRDFLKICFHYDTITRSRPWLTDTRKISEVIFARQWKTAFLFCRIWWYIILYRRCNA